MFIYLFLQFHVAYFLKNCEKIASLFSRLDLKYIKVYNKKIEENCNLSLGADLRLFKMKSHKNIMKCHVSKIYDYFQHFHMLN